MKTNSLNHMKKYAGCAALALVLLVGCQSKQDAAIDQAKKQAAATGQAQQVVSVDKNGNTTTTTVQPPVPGQTGQAVTSVVTPASAVAANAPATAGGAAPGTPGGAPVIRPADVNIPAGTTLAIRINEHISVKTTPTGSRFSGEVVEPVAVNGQVMIPKGTPVHGVVDESHRRGHFKGRVDPGATVDVDGPERLELRIGDA